MAQPFICNAYDVLALRRVRQKNFVRIQPQFDSKYQPLYGQGNYENVDTSSWHSTEADSNENAMFPSGTGEISGLQGCSNLVIPLPSTEAFHVQAIAETMVEYDARYSTFGGYSGVVGEATIQAGVRLESLPTQGILTRDKPWLKFRVDWWCQSTLETQKSEWTGEYYEGSGNPIYSDWTTVATAPAYFSNSLQLSSLGGYPPLSHSDSLYVPPQTTSGEGPGGFPTTRTRYRGSINVYDVTIYRVGNYHHA